MNTFNLKKKANPDTPKNDRPYERLYDSVVRTNITSNHEISSYKASQRKDLVTSPHGIQKDTTVSVAYD